MKRRGYNNLTNGEYKKNLRLWNVLITIILLLLVLIFVYTLDWQISKEPQIKVYYIQTDCLEEVPYIIITDNSIRAIPRPYKETSSELVERIIWCESRNDPTAKNPSSTAYGLCQFLDGTWEYVQEKWDMKLDRESEEDQLYACVRLLEEEGLVHWQPVWDCLYYEK